MGYAKIYNSAEAIESGMLINLLEENGIPCYSTESGSGEWMKITQGFSVYGQDIYVDEEDAEKAKSLIHERLEELKTEEGADADKADLSIPWYQNRMILSRVLIAVLVLISLLLIVAGKFL